MDINSGGPGTAATPVTVGVGARKGFEFHESVARTELKSAVKAAEKASQGEFNARRGKTLDIVA